MANKDNSGHVERLFYVSKYTKYINQYTRTHTWFVQCPNFRLIIYQSVCEYMISHLNDKAIIFDASNMSKWVNWTILWSKIGWYKCFGLKRTWINTMNMKGTFIRFFHQKQTHVIHSNDLVKNRWLNITGAQFQFGFYFQSSEFMSKFGHNDREM